MPRFRYRALRASGGEIAGELVAADRHEAAARLQAADSFPIEIAPSTGAGRPLRALAGRRVKRRDLILFTRQLAALNGAGVALDRALELLGHGRGGAPLLAAELLAAINRGESLSRACAGRPGLPQHYAAIIAAGEARGDIGAALERLAEVLERSRATARALLDALLYPATVLAVAAVSIAFLLGFVLPRFEVLLAGFQREPPVTMRLLLGVSALFQVVALPAAIVLLGVAGLAALRWREPGFRRAVHSALLRLPGIGPLLAQLEAERLLHLLGSLVAAGVDLPAALALTRGAMISEVFRAGLLTSERGIERGDGVAASLGAAGTLPAMAGELVRIGEETGEVAVMLLKAGDLVHREVEARSRALIGMVTPLAIVLIGLVIGAVAAAIVGTVMDVYDLAP